MGDGVVAALERLRALGDPFTVPDNPFPLACRGEIVEGDWIGLAREELIRHGRTFPEFLDSIA